MSISDPLYCCQEEGQWANASLSNQDPLWSPSKRGSLASPQCCMNAGWSSHWLKSSLINDSGAHEFGCLYQINEP